MFWTLDPIDGTKGFIRGDQYAIALALVANGEPVVGALACPSLPIVSDGTESIGCVLLATRGGGTRMTALDRERWTPANVTTATRACEVAMCEPFEKGHTSQGAAARIAAQLGITHDPVRMDSQAKYAVVARGDAGAYLRLPSRADYEEKIWDHAAGALILAEAGGRITDVSGKPLDFSLGRTLRNNRGIVAAAAGVHDEVLAAVRAEL